MSDQAETMALGDESKAILRNRKDGRLDKRLALSLLLNVGLGVGLLAALLASGRAAAASTVGMASLSHAPLSKPPVKCAADDYDKCDCGGEPVGAHAQAPPTWWTPPLTSMYQATAPLGGVEVSLSQYKAKATVVVNVASA